MRLGHEIVRIAAAEIGVKESGGNNLGPRIAEYQRATDLAPGAWPWCAAFCAWVLQQALGTQAGLELLGGVPPESWRCRSARAFDWITWAQREDLLVFDEDHPELRPLAGDFMIFDFSHIGIVEHGVVQPGAPGRTMLVETIEGNTGPKGLRDSAAGDGVMRKTRKASLCRAYVRLGRAGELHGASP